MTWIQQLKLVLNQNHHQVQHLTLQLVHHQLLYASVVLHTIFRNVCLRERRVRKHAWEISCLRESRLERKNMFEREQAWEKGCLRDNVQTLCKKEAQNNNTFMYKLSLYDLCNHGHMINFLKVITWTHVLCHSLSFRFHCLCNGLTGNQIYASWSNCLSQATQQIK